jgi:multidrug efflux pump subunit AcrA (membrane-fusion protein)
MKKILPIIILLAAIGGGAWWWRDAHASDGNRILVSGNLELTLVDLSFKIAGRMTELNVREGDWVKKWQIIARLDPMPLQQKRLREHAGAVSAESNYRQMQTSIAFKKRPRAILRVAGMNEGSGEAR